MFPQIFEQRVKAELVDRHFDTIFEGNLLRKRCQQLDEEIRTVHALIRKKVDREFEVMKHNILSEIDRQNLLLHHYKGRVYEDLSTCLSDIKQDPSLLPEKILEAYSLLDEEAEDERLLEKELGLVVVHFLDL